MGETVTPRSGRTGPGDRDHATLRQQGLLLLAGLDIRELPRGPSLIPRHLQSHPIQGPVRGRPSTRTDREHPVTWDDEGHLATLTEAGKTTSYLYDADGNRMIARDADGSQTLTLPGNTKLKVTGSGVKEGTRYYTHGGETIAVRTSRGFSYLINDHQGTAMTAVAMTTLAVTRRRQLPFGQPRSEQTESMPGTRGFVSGTADPTGLLHLGAREYDPTLGSFISVDPIIDTKDPLQMNAYTYANSRPVTASDPDGKMIYDEFTGKGYGNAKVMKNAYKSYGYINSQGDVTKKYKDRLAALHVSYNAYKRTSYYKQEKRYAANVNAAVVKVQADIRKKDEEAKRRNSDSLLGRIKQGLLDKGKKVAQSFSGDTTGMCASGSAGIGFGRSASVCFVSTRRPDGKTDYGFSLSDGWEAPSVGLNAGITFMSSNATDFEQLRGDGWGANATAAYGVGATVSHERAVGGWNSRGEPVGTTEVGLVGGIGVEGGFSTSSGTRVGLISDGLRDLGRLVGIR